MTPKDIKATFTALKETFASIVGGPNNSDVLRLTNTLALALLEIPYNDDAVGLTILLIQSGFRKVITTSTLSIEK